MKATYKSRLTKQIGLQENELAKTEKFSKMANRAGINVIKP